MEKGFAVTELPGIETLASGIEGGFGVKTFEILRYLNPHVALITESEIRKAMIWMFDHHQHIIEGSSAVAVAACLKNDLSEASVAPETSVTPETSDTPEASGTTEAADTTDTTEAKETTELDGPIVVFISGRNVSLDTLRSVYCS